MSKLLRAFVALFAVLSLSAALAACGDDDDDATDTTEDTRDAEEGGEDEGTDEGEDEGGPPEENPCAPGGSGSLGEGEAPAADATAVSVTATEYQFAGGDELATQGTYALSLTNDGQELHEAVLVRLADTETRPIADIIASGEEPEMTDVAFAFACPGTTSEPVSVAIDAPGRYAMVCFIPVGTLPSTPPEDFEGMGPPHAAQGMFKEFTVS